MSSFNFIQVSVPLLNLFKGDSTLALFFSYCLNKCQWIGDKDNWVWHTAKQFEEELCLTRTKTDTCKRKLKKFDFWESKVKKMKNSNLEVAVFHFRIDEKKLQEALNKIECKRKKTRQDNLIFPEIKEELEVIKEDFEEKKEKAEIDIQSVPIGVNFELWNEWLDYYKKQKKLKEINQKTIRLWFKCLKDARDKGIPPNDVINRTIANNWQGLKWGLSDSLDDKNRETKQLSVNFYENNNRKFIADFSDKSDC